MSKVCAGLRGDAFVVAQEAGFDNLREILDGRPCGVEALVSHMRETVFPSTEHEPERLFCQHCRSEGLSSRKNGENTPFFRTSVSVRESPIGVAFGIFTERRRRPRTRRDPEGRSVWDFTHNHEAAGSDVWLKPVFSSSSAQPSRPKPCCDRQTGNQKKVRSATPVREQYVSRRRRSWTPLTQMDPVIHLSERHRSDMLLDLSGMTREKASRREGLN